ncbi:MAG: S41 family peptidase [Rhodospirillales bacterium]
MRKSVILALAAPMAWLAAVGPVSSDTITDIARAVMAAGHDVPPARALSEACAGDALCVARFLKDRIGDGAQIVPDDGSSPRRTRWQSTSPGLHRTLVDGQGRLFLILARYDADAVLAAVSGAKSTVRTIILDLREVQHGEDLDGMRRVVSLFIGKTERAFQVHHSAGKHVDWTITPPVRAITVDRIEVRINRETDAVGEVFAALLRTHTGAVVLGQKPAARGYFHTVIPVIHGWSLAVPTARVFIRGTDFDVGLVPDGAIPE